MHGIENVFMHYVNGHSRYFLQDAFFQFIQRTFHVLDIHQHDHGKILVQDRLSYFYNVYI